jgi:hypothetical protein
MERLRFDNLDQYLLLKNGNFLYKVPFRGGWAVLKVYYDSRGWPERLYKTFDNVVLCGQTSFLPKARLRTEQDALRIWHDAGIRVFETYPGVEVEGLPPGGYALYEYVPGRNFHQLLPDETVPLDERLRWYRLFLEQWHRRHRLAVERSEPRLIHENGDFKHVMAYRDELVWFDFEMCFRSRRRVDELVAREILAYLKSLGHFVTDPKLFQTFFDETMTRYPGQDFLALVHPLMFRARNPLVRLGRALDWRFGSRAHKPHSKYNMAIRVRDGLSAAGHAPAAG